MFQNIVKLSISILLFSVLFTVGCSAQQTEEQALQSLREMTRDGKLPPEDFVAGLESRFAGKKTGALAKLLHARIRFNNNDFAGAAALLNSDVFRKKTKIADHALWLRGRALQQTGNQAEGMKVLSELLNDFPDSVRVRDAKLLWAKSAILAGRASEVPGIIGHYQAGDADAMLVIARSFDVQGLATLADTFYRAIYLAGPASPAGLEAKARLIELGHSLEPENDSDWVTWARTLFKAKKFAEAAKAYDVEAPNQSGIMTLGDRVDYISALVQAGRGADAQRVLSLIPPSAKEREEGYRQLVLGYAKAKMWPQARATAEEMRQQFPSGTLVAKTLIDAGLATRDARNRTDEGYFLNTAVAAYPNAVEVAQAQFEAAWFQHESNNFVLSSQMFIEHLGRYADKDTSNRGKAGYWAARDSERAGKLADACALYEGVNYRYGANWYGYLAFNRLTAMKNQGNCRSVTPSNPQIATAIANLKTITVAAETAKEKELNRAEKSDELSTIGLFDWAIDELQEAKKTAGNSPKINLALARHYRLKGDNTAALVAMQKSYPDYAQMFPEEMGREEWGFFYPLTNWNDIKSWAQNRGLDRYQVAGFIRQETVFDPNAKSPANAYGLMQLLLPTAQSVARKYVASSVPTSPADLFQPSLNIELGTAYMKDQFAKFGRVEYVAVAYNAGPGRVPQWRATLPAEMDEFVEAIPFKETKQYVQGIIRNSAQYRRLYDDNGNFKPNVGTRPLRGEIDSKPREQFTADNPEVVVDDNGASE